MRKKVSQTDYFKFNSKFSDNKRKIKIPGPPEDKKKKVVQVDQGKKYTVDAAIVRIMKEKKVLEVQQLMEQSVELLGSMFKVDLPVIKKCLEDLISRDYLKRDTNNRNLLWYLA